MITISDFLNSLPILIIAASSLIILILESIFPRLGGSYPRNQSKKSESLIFYFSIIAIAAALHFQFREINKDLFIYNNYLRVNNFSALLNIILLIGVLLTILASREYLEKENVNYGEYYSLLFISLLGMMLMVSANDLLIIFVGIEMMSICFYILAGFIRKKITSNESALKYFLLGAFLTGFLLLGIAFIYGVTGSTNLNTIKSLNPEKESFYTLGLLLIFIAFIFKTGSFPLQMWIPDVYQGAPTVVAGMMSSVGKTAAFGTMLVIFNSFGFNNLPLIIALIAIITMLYGNVLALAQTDIKRLLAYSSIAHAGYIMIGFVAVNPGATQSVLFYLVAYVLMQLGAFIIIGLVEDLPISGKEPNRLESFKGLARRNPFFASFFSVFLFSLAGIPPFAGFWGKYYIFLTAIKNNFIWLAIIGILFSLVGVYYYIRIVLYMWFYEPEEEYAGSEKADFSMAAALISTTGLFLFGFYPELIFKLLRTITG